MQHLIRAICLAAVATAIWLLPFPAVVGVVGVPLLVYALFANRTQRARVGRSTVLVTGASSGLGQQLALDAAARGAAKVLLVARNAQRLEQTAAQIAQLAPDCETASFSCDITDSAQVQALADDVLAQHGAPDILVHNAGAGAFLHTEETSHEQFLAHMACPTLGAAWLTRSLLPAMIARGSGHLVLVTSISSMVGFRAATSYGTARWAMRGLAGFLRADLAPLGIGVSLFNAAEIDGTGYFSGDERSHKRIPTLFQMRFITMFNTDAAGAARACWAGAEAGTYEIFHPVLLIAPTKVVIDLAPDLMNHIGRLGPAGRRQA